MDAIKFFTRVVIIVLSIMFLLTIGNFAFSFENAFKFPDKIQNVIDDTYMIKTNIYYSYMETEGTEEMKAIALYLGDGYFLALTHCTEHVGYIEFKYGYASMYQVIDIDKYEFFINDEQVQLVGRYDDISLFKSNLTHESSIKFGNSDLLKVGDKTITIGNSLMFGINVKEGMVSNLGYNYDVSLDTSDSSFNPRISFLISDPINKGDSGSALLAEKDNQYYLVGINHGYIIYGENMGCAFRSNYVKAVLKIITQDINFLE